MDEAAVKALIKTALEDFTGDLESLFEPVTKAITKDTRDYLKAVLDPLEDRLGKIEAPQDSKDEPGKSPDDTRLAKLEQSLEAERKTRESLELKAALGDILGGYDLKFADQARQGVLGAAGELKKSGDSWVTKDGRSLQEVTEEFMGTDFGKHLMNPKGKPGNGTEPPQGKQGESVDPVTALAGFF
jgi:hypothetical protein